MTGDEIIRLTLSLKKRKLILNHNYGRNREKIQKYLTTTLNLFEQEESTTLFIVKTLEKYKRYERSQFMLLEKSIRNYPQKRMAALDHCIKNELWNVDDFRDGAVYLCQHSLGDFAKVIESTTFTVLSGI